MDDLKYYYFKVPIAFKDLIPNLSSEFDKSKTGGFQLYLISPHDTENFFVHYRLFKTSFLDYFRNTVQAQDYEEKDFTKLVNSGKYNSSKGSTIDMNDPEKQR
jgi:hypothetical protein